MEQGGGSGCDDGAENEADLGRAKLGFKWWIRYGFLGGVLGLQ